MTKLDRLNTFMSERLMAVVKEIMFTVGKTVQEYEEETGRIRRENERLKEMLRDSGCFPDHANTAPVQSYQPVSPGQSRWIPSQNEEPESLEELQLDQSQCEQHPHIKPELENSANKYQESAANDNEDSQCADLTETSPVDNEMIHLNFSTKVKAEFINSDLCSHDADRSIEDPYQSWSPHSPGLPLGTADLYRVHNPNQPTINTNEAPPTGSQHSGLSQDSHYFSYHSILCTNSSYCNSKCCEMQKRTIAKSSPVWMYFSLKEGDCSKAVCLMCKAIISRGRKEYTTSALLKHLRMKHGIC